MEHLRRGLLLAGRGLPHFRRYVSWSELTIECTTHHLKAPFAFFYLYYRSPDLLGLWLPTRCRVQEYYPVLFSP